MSKTLSPNTTIAQYTIVSKLGEGGMGEVWRARDARLDREVAIKVLSADVSTNADRLKRFEQEARATSALNHPNILTVYDVGTQNGSPYIVAELLEGEELRDRLNAGAIPIRRVINYAQQIVSGLSSAHEKGIVHRDLKPENLFITKDERVKILDFGIAKLIAPPQSTNLDISEDATRKVLTNPGLMMGTVGYMSPEQVRGEKSDNRSDIFSFGAILHEMITGRRAFRRETMAETMTAILREEPDELSATNPNINPALERIVNRCLEKKPERRFQSTADLGFALEALSASSSSSGRDLTTAATRAVAESRKSVWRERLPWIVAAVFALVAVALGYVIFNRASANEKAVRLGFDPPAELAFNDDVPDWAVISPDGERVAFSATGADGKIMLYVQELNSFEAKKLPGSDNPLEPFWSPDSRSVAYGSNGKLKRSDLSGGSAQILCDSARMVGGSWSRDGTIIFVPDYRTTIVQVSDKGGEPTPVAMSSSEDQGPIRRHRYPYFLPDGRRFLFYLEQKGIWAGSLDSPEVTQIVPDMSPVVYSKQGYILFIRNDSLVAQAFDADNLTVSGEAVPIIADQKSWTNFFRFSASDNGTLVWQGTWERDYQLVWYDREGKQVGTLESPAKVAAGQDPRLSPDGKRVVIKRNPPNTLWVVDLEKGNSVRITSDFGQMPLWSPDGSRIAYSGVAGLTIKASTGLGEPEVVLSSATSGATFPCCWSPDGKFIVYQKRGVKTRLDLYALGLDEKKVIPLLNSPFDERSPNLSPDGKWLAYDSDDTGASEIYVQRFSPDGTSVTDRKRISTNGGRMAVWRRDGGELFFIAADGRLMAATVKTTGETFEFAAPKELFETRMLGATGSFHEFDVSPDGQRFLIGTLIGESSAPPPTVILNWTAMLKK